MGTRIMITGLGFSIPETLVTTNEVCSYIGVSSRAEDFERRFLMHERPLWWDLKKGEPQKKEWPGTTLAVDAGKQALGESNVPPEDVTHVMYISCTPDRNQFQADVYRIRQQLGLVQASVLHFNLGCGGIAPAIYHASVLLSTGAARHVLIVAANSTSPFMARREEYVAANEWFPLAMFNDSAGAILLSAIEDRSVGAPSSLRKVVPHKPHAVGIDGGLDKLPPMFANCFIADDNARPNGSLLATMCMETGVEPLMHVTGGGANQPLSDCLYRLHGGAVAQWYGPVMLESIEILVREVPGKAYHPAQAKLTAVHQANGNVVKQLRSALALDNEPYRLPIRTMSLCNSVSASTIDVLLNARNEKRLRPGDIVAIVTIGAGMSTGGAVFRW